MKSGLLFSCLLGAALLVGCDQAPAESAKTDTPVTSPAPTVPRFAPAAIAKAKAAISAEPRVKDLLFDEHGPVEWQVGVVGKGSPEFGYAEYLCMVVREQGGADSETILRVVDLSNVRAKAGDFRGGSLGTIRCGDATRLDDAPAARG